MAMDMHLVKERLQPAYEFLAADGFGLEVAEEAGTLDITVTAGADACAECLVPKDVMTGILNQMLDPEGANPPTLRLTYPPVESGPHD
jgi:hypothetical protein